MKKSTCDRYTIHGGKEFSWANILIDEHWGLLAIHSDYGNWTFSWPYHGRDSFRQFLMESRKDKHYFMNKLAAGERWYDSNATEKELQREILIRRRRKELTKEEAREAWEDADREIEFHSSQETYQRSVLDCKSVFDKVFGGDYDGIPCVTGFDPGMREFFRLVWPVF